MQKKFLLGDILSLTTGKLLAPIHYDGVWELVNFMVGDSLALHQVPSAREKCRAFLLEVHPQLKDVNADEVTPANYLEWLARQKETFGPYLEVEALPRPRENVVEQFGVKIGRPL